MPIAILEAQDEDIPRLFAICSLAFGQTEPAWRAFFPNHWTAAGRIAGAERYLKTKQSDPNATYHKAVDTDTSEIVGFSIWTVYQDRLLDYPPDEAPAPTYWDNADDAEYAMSIIGYIMKQRIEYIKSLKGNAVHLNTLAVVPAYQRRGIGGKLLSWGLQRADELGFASFLESSAMGRGLYEKHGFVFQRDMTIGVPEKFAGRELCCYASLIRPMGVRVSDSKPRNGPVCHQADTQ
ncbi:hypothetical protein LTR85_002112 [Meristemomyces frigidus]|nr:hypothetical protein LTR85_002112 [Meristemomyces frigidus]